MPLPRSTTHLAGLRARGERDLLFAVDRRQEHGRAERGLRHRQVGAREDVVALADETLVGSDAHARRRGRRPGRRAHRHAPRRRSGCAGRRGCRPGRPRRASAPRCAARGRSTRLQRSLTSCPAPPHFGHVCVRTNSPKALRETCCTWPIPPHTSQALIVAPGSAPLPWQRVARDRDLERDAHRDASRRVHQVDLPPRRPRRRRGRAAAPRRAREQVVAEERGEEVGEVPEVEVARLEAAGCAGRRGRTGRRAGAAPGWTAPRTPPPPGGTARPRQVGR